MCSDIHLDLDIFGNKIKLSLLMRWRESDIKWRVVGTILDTMCLSVLNLRWGKTKSQRSHKNHGYLHRMVSHQQLLRHFTNNCHLSGGVREEEVGETPKLAGYTLWGSWIQNVMETHPVVAEIWLKMVNKMNLDINTSFDLKSGLGLIFIWMIRYQFIKSYSLGI